MVKPILDVRFERPGVPEAEAATGPTSRAMTKAESFENAAREADCWIDGAPAVANSPRVHFATRIGMLGRNDEVQHSDRRDQGSFRVERSAPERQDDVSRIVEPSTRENQYEDHHSAGR